jgi:hypothetical protein
VCVCVCVCVCVWVTEHVSFAKYTCSEIDLYCLQIFARKPLDDALGDGLSPLEYHGGRESVHAARK